MTVARLVAVGSYSIAIVFFGTRRAMSFPGDEILSFDKLLHAIVFGGLGVLGFRLLRHRWSHMPPRVVWALSIGFATLLGAILEIIQSQLPYRSMEFGDLVADAVGATVLVGGAAWLRLERPICGI